MPGSEPFTCPFCGAVSFVAPVPVIIQSFIYDRPRDGQAVPDLGGQSRLGTFISGVASGALGTVIGTATLAVIAFIGLKIVLAIVLLLMAVVMLVIAFR
jgi:hypothetical protein